MLARLLADPHDDQLRALAAERAWTSHLRAELHLAMRPGHFFKHPDLGQVRVRLRLPDAARPDGGDRRPAPAAVPYAGSAVCSSGAVSAAFYDGKLRTAVDREHRDPLFASPIAFIDTASLPPVQRRERSGRSRER